MTRATRYPISVFISEQSSPIGRTRDISVSGVFLETEQRPELEAIQEITLVWGAEEFTCHARVARHADDGIGLAFINPDEKFKRVLRDMTKKAGFDK